MVVMAVQEIVLMDDPQISSYDKPLSMDERSDLVPLKLDDYDFVIGIKMFVVGENGYLRDGIPPEVGSIIAYMEENDTITKLSLTNCAQLLSEKVIKASNNEEFNFSSDKSIVCLNPRNAQVSNFDDLIGD